MLTKPFQRVLQAAAIALPLISFGTQSALADPRDFTLVNRLNVPITELYISSAAENVWGQDILGRDVLLPNESTEISFPSAQANVCNYDIKIVMKNGATDEQRGVDLCSTTTFTWQR